MPDLNIKETNHPISNNLSLYYLIREPKVIKTKKRAIILLHGVGSNENDLFNLAHQLPDDFFIIAPRGQFTLGGGRYAWYNVDFSSGKPVFNKEQELSSRAAILEFIGQIKQLYGISEIYIGGFSQGAIMSYSIGLTNPGEVKGIIALSGRLLMEVRPLIIAKKDLHQLRVFIAHGIQDNTLGVEYAREAKSYLNLLNVRLSYHEYEIGHQINNAVIKDLNDWLNEGILDTGFHVGAE